MADDFAPVVIWRRRALYFFASMMLIFVHLVPLSLQPTGAGTPDLILCITIVVVIRKATYVPYWLVGSVFLIADIMLSRPMGLWAFITLVFVEMVRANRFMFRDMFFLVEWLIVSIGFGFMILAQQLLLTFTLAKALPFQGVMWQLGLTIATYPLIVFIVSQILRISKPSPGEFNALGHKL